MQHDMTSGSVAKNLLKFALPLMLGNLLQQLYNIADTLIVGRWLGADALAAVGSSYALMVFLTSILIGLCMGSSAFFSIQFGAHDEARMKTGVCIAFLSIALVGAVLNGAVYAGVDGIIWFMRVKDAAVQALMKEYLLWVFAGLFAVFLYNFVANLLRAVGNSVVPLVFLSLSAAINIALDLWFVVRLGWGVRGAAQATVIAQYLSAAGILLFYLLRCPDLRIARQHRHWDAAIFREIAGLSLLTCMQQSVMNFGILLVQGLVNSFGTTVMAAFAAAVKIDTIAYAPIQDFGNAFSTFVAQNYGAGKRSRIWEGIKKALLLSFGFCVVVSAVVVVFGGDLMRLFLEDGGASGEIVAVGVQYLRIEGSMYFGLGVLFLFYGYYRAINRPEISVVLTVVSLGTRVVLAYLLSAIPAIGVAGIWAAVPIGWALADLTGALLLKRIDNRRGAR